MQKPRGHIRRSNSASSVPIRVADWRPASSTSAWLSGSPVIPAARLVTIEMPSTSARRRAPRWSRAPSTCRPDRHRGSAASGSRRASRNAGRATRRTRLRPAMGRPRGPAPQPRRVGVDQVDELRTDQRRAGRQVQVVADQHRLAHRVLLAQAARRVGEHHSLCARCDGGAHGMDDMAQVMAFVGVDATQHDQHSPAADLQRQHLPAVSGRGRRGESGRSPIAMAAEGSPSAAAAGAQPEPSTTATSKPAIPVRSRMAAAASAAAKSGWPADRSRRPP